jgi:hypothetical protein
MLKEVVEEEGGLEARAGREGGVTTKTTGSSGNSHGLEVTTY